MAPLTDQEIAHVVAQSALVPKYSETVDKDSAHEIITARLARAQADAAAVVATPGQPAPAAATMTAAQQQKEIARQAREQARELKKEADEAERERKAAARAAKAEQRQRERMVETSIRTAGRVVTSSAGQSLIRGVFATIFGGGKRR